MIEGLRELPALPLTYRFGRHLLDVPRRMLLTGSKRRAVPEKLFRILLLLLEANGKVVSRGLFFAEIWPNEDVSVANLTQHIFMLRALVGERAGDNSYIVTLPGRGYRLATIIEKKIGLAMKGSCERCSTPLSETGNAHICSYECTFCDMCASALIGHCANCGGELTKRPRRSARSQDGISLVNSD